MMRAVRMAFCVVRVVAFDVAVFGVVRVAVLGSGVVSVFLSNSG